MHVLPLLIILILIIYWMVQILQGNLPLLDHFMEQLFRDIVSLEPIFSMARIITDLGSKMFMVPFVIVMLLVFFILFRTVIPSIIFAGGTLLTHGINILMKEIVQRERPFVWIEASAYGYSFPSGHAMISLVCYGLFAYFLSLKIKKASHKRLLYIFFSLLIFLIGFSRFILNVHYPTDIVSGFLVGYLLLISYIYIARKFNY